MGSFRDMEGISGDGGNKRAKYVSIMYYELLVM